MAGVVLRTMATPRRIRVRALALTSATLLALAACGSDDDDDMEDQPTDMSTNNGSVVPGQPQEPVNTSTQDSQVTPTIAP